jgi:hypothetical protein
VASARARGKRPGRVYKGAGGQLRGRGVNHITGARAAWAARRCDVRRSGDQWCAAVGTPASGNHPPGVVQKLAIVTNSGTPGTAHGPLGPPVPRRARAARVRPLAWHARTTSCMGALWRSRCICVSLSHFQNSFSLNFQTKVHLTIRNKVEDQTFLYNFHKGW